MKILTGVLSVVLLMGTAWAGDYTIHGDGTVTDNGTGLRWQQEDNNTTRTWKQFLAYCEGLGLAGHEDWLLPNVKELKSLTDSSRFDPAIDVAAFPSTKSNVYWSSTTVTYGPTMAWVVNFGDGATGEVATKTGSTYARCVRGGQ